MIDSAKGDTRTRILDAAEKLFAERGFDGTSIREVTRAAEVNVAAVHYHFGSKEAVMRGITDRVAGPISQRRAQLLEGALAAAHPGPPDVEALLDAFLRADVELLLELQDGGPRLARFLGRTYSDQTDWIQRMAAEQYAEATEFYAHLAAALPHVDIPEIAWRMRQVVAAVVHMFATWPEDGLGAADAEALLRRMVTFLSAGLRAPMPSSGVGGEPEEI